MSDTLLIQMLSVTRELLGVPGGNVIVCLTRSLSMNRIIGLSDGLTVPFALTAGLSSLGTSKLVVYGGIAELIAGAISMGVGGFRK